VHRQRNAPVDDRTHRPQKPLLVVPERLRRARDEDDLPAVTVDVGLEERDLVLFRRALNRSHERVQRVRGGVRPFGRDDLVGPCELQKRDCGVPVLALEWPDLEELCPERCRNSELERDARDVGQGRDRTSRFGRRDQQATRSLFVTDPRGVEELHRLGAEEDLAGLRRRLHLHGSRAPGTRHEQLAMRIADEEEVEIACVQPRVHLQLHCSRRGTWPPDRTQRSTHLECSPRGPRRVVFAVVEKEERVPSELEQTATLLVRDLEECRERRVHHLGHFLRAGPSQARQPLGHRGEAGDVDEREGSLELEPAPLGVVAEPFERQPGNERDKVRVAACRRALRRRGYGVVVPKERQAATPIILACTSVPFA
jgi:hypothetical protein